ncbi:efflux RND transporter periplasmic adaptor subunit [Microvirga thermotolerans]|uniref:Efflux RND transporter periplasmic adaptor subunit n=1 Tax=Microvirga thermotolerans TaxID=2651334 RepID=A0A5P9JUD3_9HYPH|nr:efflux RND transporter periplasmic adaptor subunit [Microvirga thermotolerans]QFU14795.1 efflux RND transporter periplasmic adaptor subunit [Microvirga thermotolerans]
MRVAAWGLIGAALVLPLPAHAQGSPPPAVSVGTLNAELKPVSKSVEFVGRIEAPERVEVRARVKGYLEDVLFKEGDSVKEGDPLYRIEQGLFEADVQQAQGALERSKAAYTLAVIQLQRAEELLSKNAGTVVARDQARALEQQSKGAVLSDEANLRTAEINLGYTNITAPIAGRIGRSSVTRGNVVGPDSGVLAMIVSQDPMYVTFPVSQREFLGRTGKEAGGDPKDIRVQVRFSDGTLYDQVGRINFVDVTVDRTTDTVTARATLPNPDGALTDGQLVRVLLGTGAAQEKVVVPQSALIADQAGVYVFVVQDGKAAVRRVKPSGELGAGAVIEEGLAPGDQVIVEGLQSVRAGTPVRATPAARPLDGM